MVNEETNIGIYLIAGVILIVGLIACLAIVPAGFVGVKDTFGSVDTYPLQPGMSMKSPFTGVITYSTQTMEIKEESQTPTSEGLIVDLEVSMLYHIVPSEAPNIYKNIGTSYDQVVIVPNLRSAIREITAENTAKDLYSSGRQVIETNIKAKLDPLMANYGIVIDSILLRNLILPETVKNAIESKLAADQEQQMYDFLIAKESKEAERKIIEARGIATSQAIIDNSLTEQYLEWYFISHIKDYEATIFVPTGQNGLPLFGNVDDYVIKPTIKSSVTNVSNV